MLKSLRSKINGPAFWQGFLGAVVAMALLGGIPSVYAAVMNATVTTANTTTTANAIVATCNTTGTPGTGYGCGIQFVGQDASKTAGGDIIAQIAPNWATATAGAEDSRLDYLLRSQGNAKAIKHSLYEVAGVTVSSWTDGTTTLLFQAGPANAYIGTSSAHDLNLQTGGSTRWGIKSSTGILQADATGGYIDLSTISAGGPNLKLTATSDTPGTTFSAVNATNAEVLIGASARYIPLYN